MSGFIFADVQYYVDVRKGPKKSFFLFICFPYRSIMKGGAVALDGRIDPGDMILQVNEIGFDNMSNDDAVRVLKEVVQKPGPIKLVVAKVNKYKIELFNK